MPPTPMRPEDLFRAEKERATSAARSLHARLLAEAKVAFEKLMAEGQAARKSGRPRKHPLPPLKTGSALRPQGQMFERFEPVPAAVAAPVAAPAAKAAPPVVPKVAKSAKPKSKVKVKVKANAKAKAKAKAKSKLKPKTMPKAKAKAKAKGKRSKR